MQLRDELNPYAPPDAAGELRFLMEGERELQILASRMTRLGAALLDGLLYMACFVPAYFAVFLLMSERVWSASSDFYMTLFLPMGVGALAALALAAYQWYLIATSGQSLGKKWLGIQIVRMDGSRVDFVSGVVLRSWILGFVGMVPYIGGCVGLLDVLWIFGEEHRCLHDHIAGTKVIVKSLRAVG